MHFTDHTSAPYVALWDHTHFYHENSITLCIALSPHHHFCYHTSLPFYVSCRMYPKLPVAANQHLPILEKHGIWLVATLLLVTHVNGITSFCFRLLAMTYLAPTLPATRKKNHAAILMGLIQCVTAPFGYQNHGKCCLMPTKWREMTVTGTNLGQTGPQYV